MLAEVPRSRRALLAHLSPSDLVAGLDHLQALCLNSKEEERRQFGQLVGALSLLLLTLTGIEHSERLRSRDNSSERPHGHAKCKSLCHKLVQDPKTREVIRSVYHPGHETKLNGVSSDVVTRDTPSRYGKT